MSDLTDELTKLAALRDRGVLTQAEFDAQKAQLLGKPTHSTAVPEQPAAPPPPVIDRAPATAATVPPAGPNSTSPIANFLKTAGGKVVAGLGALGALAVIGSAMGGGSTSSTTQTASTFGGSAGGSGGDISVTRDAAVGAPYGSVGPRSCSPRNIPSSGQPSVAQINTYVTCSREGIMGDGLFLVDNVDVTAVSQARAYDPHEIYASGAVDVNRPIYDIQGTLETWQCRKVGTPDQLAIGIGTPAGKTCVHYTERNAEGSCYSDTFGNWACTMVDRGANQPDRTEVAPPA